MKAISRARLARTLFQVGVFSLGTSSAIAQGFGPAGSLGGYGAASGYAGAGMGGGPMIIPYGGMFEGFMPDRMPGGSRLSYRPRGAAGMDPGRASSRLPSLSGGMNAMSGGVGGPGARAGGMSAFGNRGRMGLGGVRGMSGAGGSSVMPPNFGYPFRQPPSLLSPSSAGAGMSM